VTQASSQNDPAGALRALEGLEAELQAAQAKGQISDDRRRSITTIATAVRADLDDAVAAAQAVADKAAADKAAADQAAAEQAAAAKAAAEAAAAPVQTPAPSPEPEPEPDRDDDKKGGKGKGSD
jgi:membrane protein involved in colicin uptake